MATKDDTTEATWRESEDSEWGHEVESESQIVMEMEGDGFIATFTEMDPANANGITQAHFTNVSTLTEEYLGDAMFMNAGRDLERKLKSVPKGSQVRIQWVSSMNTGQKSPMRVYKVQWR